MTAVPLLLQELMCSHNRPPHQSGRHDLSPLKVISRSNSSHFGAERSGIHNHSRRQSPIQLLFSGAEMTATTSADDGDDLLGRSVAAADLFCGRKSFFDTEDLCAILNNPTSVVNQQQQRSRLAFKHRCGSFVFSSIFEVACWLNEK
jgi:hypothetical protein